jgi:hypothetical protein
MSGVLTCAHHVSDAAVAVDILWITFSDGIGMHVYAW